MTITREEIHNALDAQLDKWGYKNELNIERGRITIEVQIENGKKTVTIAERQIVR